MMDDPMTVGLQVCGVDYDRAQNLINRVGKHPCRYHVTYIRAISFIPRKSLTDGICVN